MSPPSRHPLRKGAAANAREQAVSDKAKRLEKRRLQALRMLKRRNVTQAEVARRLGVSPGAVSIWVNAAARGGVAAKPRTGRKSRLTDAQWAHIEMLMRVPSTRHRLAVPRWTLQAISWLIFTTYKVSYHPRYLERPLRARGIHYRNKEYRQ